MAIAIISTLEVQSSASGETIPSSAVTTAPKPFISRAEHRFRTDMKRLRYLAKQLEGEHLSPRHRFEGLNELQQTVRGFTQGHPEGRRCLPGQEREADFLRLRLDSTAQTLQRTQGHEGLKELLGYLRRFEALHPRTPDAPDGV